MLLTLCLSMCKGLRFGSNNKRCGSRFTGDCLLPLLHNDHSGFIKPQNAGPEIKTFLLLREFSLTLTWSNLLNVFYSTVGYVLIHECVYVVNEIVDAINSVNIHMHLLPSSNKIKQNVKQKVLRLCSRLLYALMGL